jgi:hypothetical protein
MAANRFDQLIAQWEPRLRQAFTEAIQNVRSGAQIELIARMLEKGDVDGALRAVGLNPTQFRIFDKTFEAAYESGGLATTTALPPMVDGQGFKVRFQFSIRNPQAEMWLRQYSSQMITGIVDDQKTMIRGFLRDGLSKGLNPRTTALDLVGRIGATGRREGGVIGLTESQEQWARNYAEELASENPRQALTRALRDKRFDRAVLKAAQSGEPIPAELRGKMVAAYRNRALRYRAETIARSETITALHQAQSDALDQATQSGLSADAVTMTWRSARDARVRDAHRELDGQSVRRGGVFASALGPIRFPGDPEASAANVINCRCYLEPSVDFLAGIK